MHLPASAMQPAPERQITPAQPGGNATGFTHFEYGISAKGLELLRDVVPTMRRVAVVRDPTARGSGGQLGAIQGVAPSFGIEIKPIDPRDGDALAQSSEAFAQVPNGGLIVTSGRLAIAHRSNIIALAAHHKLPTIYSYRYFVAEGALAARSCISSVRLLAADACQMNVNFHQLQT
jgi:putative tryptophan/tyrosine transport system substrate-binding protein